jgi:hypothetical protein
LGKVVAQFKKKKGMGYHFKKGPGGTMQVVEVPMSELRRKRKKGKSGGGRKKKS